MKNSCTFDSMFFGAWVGGEGEFPQPTVENVKKFQNLQGRHLDVINHFVAWFEHGWEWTKPFADVARRNGSVLMITWMPMPYTAADILAGFCDQYIDDFAEGVKTFGDEIWMRPLHEANGDWYSWGVGADCVKNSNENVAAAFRYIVNRFRKKNVENVKWVWTTNVINCGEGTSLLGTYPGDEYVDYTSIDGYNWGSTRPSGWLSFSEVFASAYRAVKTIEKPMFIAEFSSTEAGGNKGRWFTEMFRDLMVNFPEIKGLVLFSQSKDHEADWGLDSSEDSVAAWKDGLGLYPMAKRV